MKIAKFLAAALTAFVFTACIYAAEPVKATKQQAKDEIIKILKDGKVIPELIEDYIDLFWAENYLLPDSGSFPVTDGSTVYLVLVLPHAYDADTEHTDYYAQNLLLYKKLEELYYGADLAEKGLKASGKSKDYIFAMFPKLQEFVSVEKAKIVTKDKNGAEIEKEKIVRASSNAMFRLYFDKDTYLVFTPNKAGSFDISIDGTELDEKAGTAKRNEWLEKVFSKVLIKSEVLKTFNVDGDCVQIIKYRFTKDFFDANFDVELLEEEELDLEELEEEDLEDDDLEEVELDLEELSKED